MKTRLEMLNEIKDATLESQILLEVEMEHGMRMAEKIKGAPKTGQMRYQIGQEVKKREFEVGNKRIAIEILEDMIAEEKGDKPKTTTVMEEIPMPAAEVEPAPQKDIIEGIEDGSAMEKPAEK